MLKRFTQFSAAAAMALVFAGCPGLNPPYDATGTYEGTFTLGAGATQIAQNCAITLKLEQNIDAGPVRNAKVAGTVELSLACVGGDVPPVLDGVLGTLLGVEPIEVSGAMLPDGTLELNTDGLLNECPTNDCERLVLLGSTLDTDKDGKMDTYTGTIGGLVQVSGSLVPLIGNFTTAVATAS